MRRSSGFTEPVIFLVAMGTIMGLLLTVFSIFGGGPIGSIFIGAGAIVKIPIGALIISFVYAGIMFVIWRLVGSSESFETAYRCIAYASATYPVAALLSLIPYIGTLVGVIWPTFLIYVASIEIHKLDRHTAIVITAILGGVVLLWKLDSERDYRQLQAYLEQMGISMEDFENMPPEQTRKALGEFIKGLEEGSKSE
jgi:hypothetical protein